MKKFQSFDELMKIVPSSDDSCENHSNCHALLTHETQMLWQISQQFMQNSQYIIGGLLSTVIFESILKKLEGQQQNSFEKNPSYSKRITLLKNNKIIEPRIYSWMIRMATPNSPRNEIVHPPNGYIQESPCHQMFNFLTEELGTKQLNYEELATIERDLFDYMWDTIGGTLPNQITKQYFDNLIEASTEYMAPLGAYLTKHCPCIKDKNNGLSFATLSRVNATSGYVWLAVIKRDRQLRARIRLPSLTILFKPSGISIYIELPGRSHEGKNFKKHYYEMLLNGKIDKYLTQEMANNDFEFFNTLWYAEREHVGLVSGYLEKKKEFKENFNWTNTINYRIEQTTNIECPITGNSFLIGKFYSRKECLEKYSTNMHKKISQDLEILFPLLKGIYEK